MNNQTNEPEGSATQSDHLPAGGVVSQEQSATLKWGLVFYKFGSTAGIFFNTNIDISDSLGAVMERVRAQYEAFLLASWLRLFVSKVVVERATVDHPTRHDIESQNFPIRADSNTNIIDNQLTEAFRDPRGFYHISAQNAEFAIFSSPTQSAPLSQTVLLLRAIPNKKRLFWMAVLVILAILAVAGIVTGALTKSMGTSFLVIGTLMGLFALIVGVATVLWKS